MASGDDLARRVDLRASVLFVDVSLDHVASLVVPFVAWEVTGRRAYPVVLGDERTRTGLRGADDGEYAADAQRHAKRRPAREPLLQK